MSIEFLPGAVEAKKAVEEVRRLNLQVEEYRKALKEIYENEGPGLDGSSENASGRIARLALERFSGKQPGRAGRLAVASGDDVLPEVLCDVLRDQDAEVVRRVQETQTMTCYYCRREIGPLDPKAGPSANLRDIRCADCNVDYDYVLKCGYRPLLNLLVRIVLSTQEGRKP